MFFDRRQMGYDSRALKRMPLLRLAPPEDLQGTFSRVQDEGKINIWLLEWKENAFFCGRKTKPLEDFYCCSF